MKSLQFETIKQRPIVFSSVIVICFIFIKSFATGTFGKIGPDSDDLFRLIQVRDFLAGQSWFDLHQYRLGADGGTLMHWSRIADMPLIVITAFFDLFLPYNTAESVALTVWPPITAIFVLVGLLTAARRLPGRYIVGTTLVLTILYLINHHRFAPGALDHHNLQLGLLALGLGCILDLQFRVKSYALGGIALGTTFTIGMEIYVYSALLCLCVAALWFWFGDLARRAVIAFGVSFAAILGIIFFGTIAPQNYAVIQCDSYSSIIFLVGAVAGIGLAVVANSCSVASRMVRAGVLACIGVSCLFLIGFMAPQCLSNPLSALPYEARVIWLGMIQEAKPMWMVPESLTIIVPYMMGVQILAIGLCISQLHARRCVAQNLIFLTLGLSAVFLTIYQVRFLQFGFLFSILPLAMWIARVYERAIDANTQRSGAIGALALSMPFFWALPSAWIETSFAADEELGDIIEIEEISTPEGCYGPALMEALNELPPGLVVANANAAPFILEATEHRVLTGNYHRNPDGIVDGIRIFTYAPEFSAPILKKTKADYMVFCHPTNFTRVMIQHNPEGLLGALAAQNIPSYLEHVESVPIVTDSEPRAVDLYRINP